jgi:fluoride exporter
MTQQQETSMVGGADGRRIPLHTRRRRWDIVAVIALGGALGAVVRQLVSEALPHAARGFPFGTFVVNVSGCLLIGLLMVSIVEVWRPHRLVRPFLGIGLLGGYTTFSTYVVETRRLIQVGDPRVAFAYFGGTVVGALVAVQVGVLLARSPRAFLRRRAER